MPPKSKKRSYDPSRRGTDHENEIIQAVRDAKAPLTIPALAQHMRLPPAAHAALSQTIEHMVQEGALFQNRKGTLFLPSEIDMVTGMVVGHPDGYGFLETDPPGENFYLSPNEMKKALHGDRVTARIVPYESHGKRAASILDVLVRGVKDIVGRLYERHGVWFVVAEDKRINQDLLLAAKSRGKAKEGDIVVVTLIEPPSATREAIVRIKEILGRANDDDIEIEIALRQYDLPFCFSREALNDAKKAGKKVKAADKKAREDLTALPFVTIDGETARDFDDAVYAEKEGRGFRLLVAIADVSHYVKEGTALDAEAYERGTSVYFPRRVIPMLPETLSNGLCSLIPNEDRLAVVCELHLSPKGVIKQYRFFPATIQSHARLTYHEVWEYLSQNKKISGVEKTSGVYPSLDILYALYKHLLDNRKKRGAIDFETQETELVFDPHGKIEHILPTQRNDAHRLIEECMLAANVCAAEFLREHKVNTLYRVHDKPSAERLTTLKNFLSMCSLQLGGGNTPETKDYAKLLDKIADRPDRDLLQTLLLRSLQRAEYHPEDKEHFGLAYEHYTHFTSPIRRYPDLLVHRGILSILEGHQDTSDIKLWEDRGAHCSQTERRADEASRSVENWLKCVYIQQHIGETMQGTISGVTHFGLFVTLDKLAIDGLIHISELGSDYFIFDPSRHVLTGQYTGLTYQLTDRISVRVARADPESGKIDFQLDHVFNHPSPKKRAKASRRI
ncbi:MAG: ribonuclease R [Burkholderiales bacterium]|jgi:ribonuclease R|nr:ribonuclease R [Burkholderiales bacterium]